MTQHDMTQHNIPSRVCDFVCVRQGCCVQQVMVFRYNISKLPGTYAHTYKHAYIPAPAQSSILSMMLLWQSKCNNLSNCLPACLSVHDSMTPGFHDLDSSTLRMLVTYAGYTTEWTHGWRLSEVCICMHSPDSHVTHVTQHTLM